MLPCSSLAMNNSSRAPNAANRKAWCWMNSENLGIRFRLRGDFFHYHYCNRRMIAKRRKYALLAAAALAAGFAVADERYQQSAEELAKVHNRIEAVSKSIEADKVEQDK